MAREQIAPTKSNLLRTKERLATAREGYELLDQKREILVMELMRSMERVKLLEQTLDEQIERAYPALRRMLLSLGREKARNIARSVRYSFDLREKTELVAGMHLPSLEVHLPKAELKFSPANSFAECDETVIEFFALLETITEMAAVRTIATRLAREVRKTQRRVNALDKVLIPVAEETLEFIESSLEERDREAIFVGKLLKKKAGLS